MPKRDVRQVIQVEYKTELKLLTEPLQATEQVLTQNKTQMRRTAERGTLILSQDGSMAMRSYDRKQEREVD